ncbi:MAG: hypothetical protein AAGN82_15340 [Myxococcota bacterium]
MADKEQTPTPDASKPGGEEPAAPATTWWEDVRNHYLSLDRRTLGLTRIFIGFYLVFDLFRRTEDWGKLFSNDGVLPTHFNLWRPQSGGYTFLNGFADHPELALLWCFALAVFVSYLIGFKTKAMQIIAAVLVASLNGRVLLIENGGYVVQNLLMMWTAFLPLGDRFSVDALREGLRVQREQNAEDLNDRRLDVAAWRVQPHVSIVGLFILIQLAAIYFFNVVHKTGTNWRNGSAVHYVIYVDRMVTPLFAWGREYVPNAVEIFLTKTVLAAEAGLPVALLSPVARVWARRLVIVFINFLHLGFGSTFVLGPFAWALCCFSVLLIGTEDWELVIRTMKRVSRARTVRYRAESAWAFQTCRILKRLDRFELLHFEADPNPQSAWLTVCRRDGTHPATGYAAHLQLVHALPSGPPLAWALRTVLRPVGVLVTTLWTRLGPFLGYGRRTEAAVPAGYRPELRDDAGNPIIDGHFTLGWLRRYFAPRRFGFTQFRVGIALTIAGFFGAIYLAPMLEKKAKVDVAADLVGGMSIEGAYLWGGVLVMFIGLHFLARPLLIMNFRTPGRPARKWTRITAGFREAFAILMFVGAVNQALVELWVARPLKLPQPELARLLVHKFRYLQGWFMFSPNPVMDDGTIVVDAITVDGRRVDPFSVDTYDRKLEPPRYDLLHAKSFKYNQIWSDYFNRIHMPGNTVYRRPMKEYMFALPERTGDPNDAIVKGVVYWVHDMNPKWDTTNSYGYGLKELFKFSNPDPDVQRRFRENTGGEDPPEIELPNGKTASVTVAGT